MQGHHYSVNGRRFKNYYAALRHSGEVNSFAEYVIPRTHLDAYESVSVKACLTKTPEFFIKEKISYIFKNFQSQRLHYSGGSDSHTIMQIATDMGYKFTDSLTACSSVTMDEYVDEEYVLGIEHIKKNPNCVANPEVFYPSLKHFEDLWRDPETFYNQSGAYFSFRPIYTDIIMQGRTQREAEITGHSKQKIIRKDNQYYWVLFSCNDEYISLDNEISFYGDGLIPELAVQQAYINKDFFTKVLPAKDDTKLEVLSFERIPEHLRNNLNTALGRTPTLSYKLTIGTILGKADGLNEKNHRSMKEIQSQGRQDILNMWDNTRKKIISDLKDIPHGIELISQKCAVDGYKENISIPKRVSRIGFAYRLDSDKIVPIDHTELFL